MKVNGSETVVISCQLRYCKRQLKSEGTEPSHSTNPTVSERGHGGEYWERSTRRSGRAKEPATRDALRGANLPISKVLEERKKERAREARTETIHLFSTCQDGTDRGSQGVEYRGHCSRIDGVAGKGQCRAGDQPT